MTAAPALCNLRTKIKNRRQASTALQIPRSKRQLCQRDTERLRHAPKTAQGSSWGPFGGILGLVGASWACLAGLQGALGSLLEAKMGPRCAKLGSSWPKLSPSWTQVGILRRSCRLGRILEATWRRLGRSWGEKLRMSLAFCQFLASKVHRGGGKPWRTGAGLTDCAMAVEDEVFEEEESGRVCSVV